MREKKVEALQAIVQERGKNGKLLAAVSEEMSNSR